MPTIADLLEADDSTFLASGGAVETPAVAAAPTPAPEKETEVVLADTTPPASESTTEGTTAVAEPTDPSTSAPAVTVPPASTEPPAPALDYATEYNKALAPLKAAKQVIQIKDVDELRRLAQMGVDYNRKMQMFAQERKLGMTLQKNNIGEADLAMLIAINNGDAKAISQLLKQKNIDIHTLDTEEQEGYSPDTGTLVDAKEFAFRSAIADLQEAPGGVETLQVVNAWDAESKTAAVNDPTILPLIHLHREKGYFGIVEAEINKRQALGTLTSMPFISAYKLVGDELNAQGAFDVLKTPTPTTTPIATTVATPKPAVKAAPTNKLVAPRTTQPTGKKVEFSKLAAMSDDDFLKQTF